MQTRIPAVMMRGGTSKGLYFLATDLPEDTATRDAVLLAAMGSPDQRQIDGVGGADPLTSKVAIVSRSNRPGMDVDYLFAQVVVDEAKVDVTPNCGNMLAGVGPFAIEQGLVKPAGDETRVRIFMVNSEMGAEATVKTPGGQVEYEGTARIDGVPGTAAPIPISFLDTEGSACGALLPTGNVKDTIDGIGCTLIDNGMPVVVMAASDLGRTGYETKAQLDADAELKAKIEFDPPQGGADDEPGQRDKGRRAEDVPRRGPSAGWGGDDALLHPACLPFDDRRAGRRDHRHRLRPARLGGRRHCPGAARQQEDTVGRASDGRVLGRARARRHRSGAQGRAGRAAAHRAAAVRGQHPGAVPRLGGPHPARGGGMKYCQGPDPDTKRPSFAAPAGACDSHCHVFGPAAKFPFAENRTYTPPDAPFEALQKLQSVLGLERAVIVQATCHGTDNRATLDAIARSNGRYRGVAIVDDSFKANDLEELDQGGIRGIRFSFARHLAGPPDFSRVRRIADRVRPLGWHLVLYLEREDLAASAETILKFGMPVVIDHMGRAKTGDGIAHPTFRVLLDLVRNEDVWVKICGPERISTLGPPFEDAVPFAQALIEAAPDRVLWGTDWPHPNIEGTMPNDGDLMNLLALAAPDAAMRNRILVDNPARLYGFGDGQ